MRVADWLLNHLAEIGIHHVFLVPGGGAMHLNDALALEGRIEAVPCHHEQACAIAAEAYGRVGSKESPAFGVAMVTTGPGSTNAITPVAGAWIDSIPLLILSGQAKQSDLLKGRPLRQGGVQEVDIIPMVRSITKYAVTVTEPGSIRHHLEKALYLMREGRPGPVWLDIPLDVQAATVEPEGLEKWSPVPPSSSRTNSSDLGNVVDLLGSANRPLLLAGHGVRLAGGQEALTSLVEFLQIPTVTTWNAMDLLPYEHPMNIGRPGVVAARAANFAVQNCDLLIVVGARLDPVVTAYNPGGFARAARKVVVDIDPHELEDKQRTMGIEVPLVMDAREFLWALRKAAGTIDGKTDWPDWRARCTAWKRRYPIEDGRLFPANGPVGHAHFVAALSQAMPPDVLVTTGSSGLAIEFFYAGFKNKTGQRCFLTSGLGAMGYGLPAAIGACLANERRSMVAVESDGSLQMNLQELATLAGLQLPVCLFVMNNGGYASIRNTQRNYFQGRYLGSGADSGLNLPDLGLLAETYGLGYQRIDDCSGLVAKLEQALALPRPCLVDVRLVHDEPLQPKCSAIPCADGSMLSMPLEDMSPLMPLEQLRQEMLIPLTSVSVQAERSAN